MKPQVDFNPVEHIGEKGAESQFTIASNAQAFEILSAGIYTDPIAAVIRELSCNAYDSHVEADKGDTPFEIHLPNRLEPHFSVTDHGIGLSDDQIRSLFSTYFQSSKTDTNKQIGAFGLGSKSPFSYSKSFTIVSRFDKKIRTYAVYVNDNGVPTIEENACVDTDECNGIEVRLAVRSQDYDTFITKTRDVLQYFPVKPTIKGRSEFSWPTISESASVTDTYIVDKENYGELIAVQGNVPYKVTKDMIESLVSSATARFMRKHRIVLFFDIGLIGIAANREEVRYDETSAKNIAEALAVAFEEYVTQLDAQLTELTKTGSKWEIFSILRTKFGSKSALEQLVGQNYKFTSDMANEWMEDDELEYSTSHNYHKIIPYQKGDVRAVRGHVSTRGYGKDRRTFVKPDAKVQVVLQDVTKRGSMRMNTKLERGYNSAGCTTIYAIIPITDRMLASAGVKATKAERDAELVTILEEFGNPEIKVVSEWTEDVAQAARAARTSGHTFRKFKEPGGRRDRTQKAVFSEAPEPDNGGVYIEVDLLRNLIIKGTPVSVGGRELSNMLTAVLNVINVSKGTTYVPEDVYALSKKVVKYVSADTANWNSVIDLYKEAIKDQLDIIEYYNRIGNSTILNMNHSITKGTFVQMVRDLDTNSTFRSLVEPIIEKAKEANKLSVHATAPLDRDDFRNKLVQWDRYWGIKHVVDTTSFFKEADFAPYRMLRHIDFGYGGDVTDAKEYIELIEA